MGILSKILIGTAKVSAKAVGKVAKVAGKAVGKTVVKNVVKPVVEDVAIGAAITASTVTAAAIGSKVLPKDEVKQSNSPNRKSERIIKDYDCCEYKGNCALVKIYTNRIIIEYSVTEGNFFNRKTIEKKESIKYDDIKINDFIPDINYCSNTMIINTKDNHFNIIFSCEEEMFEALKYIVESITGIKFNEIEDIYSPDDYEEYYNSKIEYIRKKKRSLAENDNTKVCESDKIDEQIKLIGRLKELLDNGAITESEFEKKKCEILNL